MSRPRSGRDAARYAAVTPRTVRRAIVSGELTPTRTTYVRSDETRRSQPRYEFEPDEVERWAASRALLSAPQAAAQLGVTRQTIYRMAKRGQLTPTTVGKRPKFLQAEINALLAQPT